MLPLILGAVAVAGLIAGGVALAAALFEDAYKAKLVLVGPKRAGKTTWRTFLTDGSLPAGYEHTYIEQVLEKKVELKDLKIRVELLDMSGSDDAVPAWHEAARKTDHIFFFVDGTRLDDRGYWFQATTYARVVSSWTDVKADVALVVTHADEDPDGKAGDLDAIRTRSDVTKLARLLNARRTVVGDLGSPDGLQDFTVRALAELEKAK